MANDNEKGDDQMKSNSFKVKSKKTRLTTNFRTTKNGIRQ